MRSISGVRFVLMHSKSVGLMITVDIELVAIAASPV
jgi:hypothetical protein